MSVPAPAHDAGTPLTANDDDLIEKEWVQKAKQIVASTKNDPYRQEQEVSKLQADYLQKRYGKEIKLQSE
jgi:Txe/YoeB family toxin of Txe-Axe toxin-antitoxin module